MAFGLRLLTREQVGPGECEEFKQFILSRLLPGAEGHPLPPSVNTALIKSIALIVVVQPKAFPDVFSFTFRLIQHSDLYTRLTGKKSIPLYAAISSVAFSISCV